MYFLIFLFSLFCSAIFKNVQNLFFQICLAIDFKMFSPRGGLFCQFSPWLTNECLPKYFSGDTLDAHFNIQSQCIQICIYLYMFYVQKYVQKLINLYESAAPPLAKCSIFADFILKKLSISFYVFTCYFSEYKIKW